MRELGAGGDDEGNVAAFLAYLVTVVGVAPQTADSYLTHVLKRAVATRALASTDHIRTLYNRGVIRGLKRAHDDANPARDRTRIPLTYPLVVGAAKTIDSIIGDARDKLALKAALGLAYGLSMRPGEYLKLSGAAERKPQEQALASHAYLWWDGQAYPVTAPQNFPKGPAQFFTLRVDFLKQDQTGKGMPRAVAAPSRQCEFSCVAALENYCRAVRLQPGDALIQRQGGQLTWSLFRWLMRMVAEAHGLDPERLVVHSCRYGAVNQLVAAGFDETNVMMQGGWATPGGAKAYIMPSIMRASRTADAVHDATLVPIDWLRHAFNTGKGGKKGQH